MLTKKQTESRKADALRPTRKFLPDRDLRRQVDGDGLKGNGKDRRNKIRFPNGENPVSIQTRRELLDRIKELESENEDLQSRIDEISEIVGDDSEEEDEDEGRD
jgi:hypothetical protein